MFPDGNEDFECFENFSTVAQGLRYQGIGSFINLSVFLQSGMAWAGPKKLDESLPATAPSAHSGFSKSRLCLHVMIIIQTSVCDFSR